MVTLESAVTIITLSPMHFINGYLAQSRHAISVVNTQHSHPPLSVFVTCDIERFSFSKPIFSTLFQCNSTFQRRIDRFNGSANNTGTALSLLTTGSLQDLLSTLHPRSSRSGSLQYL